MLDQASCEEGAARSSLDSLLDDGRAGSALPGFDYLGRLAFPHSVEDCVDGSGVAHGAEGAVPQTCIKESLVRPEGISCSAFKDLRFFIGKGFGSFAGD